MESSIKSPSDLNYYEQIWQKAKVDNSSLIASSSIKESYKVAHSIVVLALQKNRNLITSAFRLNTGDVFPVYFILYKTDESRNKSKFGITLSSEFFRRKIQDPIVLFVERIEMSEFIPNYIVEKIL